MNDQSKSKDDLIRELLGLRMEHASLKALFDHDITERKQTDEMFEKSQALLKSSIECQKDTIFFSIDRNYRYLFFNKVHSEIMKVTNDKDITEGMNFLECINSAKDRELAKEDYDRVLMGESYSNVRVFGDVEPVFFEIFFNPIINEKNEIIGATTLTRNITERIKVESALKESEERFRHIASTISDISYSCERDKNGSYSFSWITGATMQITGYTNEEIKAMKCWGKLVIADDMDSFDQNVINLSPGSTRKCELRLRQKNGSVIWVESYVECLISEDQPERHKLYGALVDVTERRKAEETLRKIEAKYTNLFENVQDVFYQIDLDGIIQEISPSIKYFSEFKSEELLGANVSDLYYNPEDRTIFLDAIKIKGEIRDYELFLKTKSGGKRVVSLNARLIFDADGKPNHIDGALRDITDRKLAEEKILEKDVQFRKLSSNLPDLIYQFTRRVDGTYCVPIASEGIKNIFGCSPEDVVEDFTPIGRVIHPEDLDRVIKDIEYSAEHLTFFTCEYRVQLPGKPIQWLFSRATPEKLADGTITWYGFNADITEMKQSERELVKAKERAEESDRLKSAFLANMSHEIRTPMNGILGFAHLLQEPDLTGKEQQEYIRIIEKSGKRMLNIIHDIVDISKIESGQMEISISETNINEEIKFIFDFYQQETEKKGLQFFYKTTLPPEKALIKTDREKIYAILTNLVKNAIKYTNAGSIAIGYSKKDKFIEFFVKDSGVGISKDRQEAIFERFIQADISNNRAYDGAGLGLSIAKGYVEMLGGKIWVESQEREGSTFYFTIPYNCGPEGTGVDENVIPSNKAENQIKNLKILIAEDDETSEMLMRLEVEIFGREILAVGTGTDAVETCRNNPDIDLILMDIRMPKMNGYEATRQIRRFNKDVIIIAQTAYGLSGDREKALEAGCSDYISKPIGQDELLVLLKKYFK